MEQAVILEKDGPLRRVTLNRPNERNAVNSELHRGLTEAWREIALDDQARAVILTGAGPAFTAGGDLNWLRQMQTNPKVRRLGILEARELFISMASCQVPIVCAVNGPAVGLGCSLAVLSDIVLISDRAFLSDPHVAIGLVAGDGGAVAWPAAMSLLHAKEYLYTGDRVGPHDAVRLGLANRVVDSELLLQEAETWAQRLAALPSRALQDTKRALNMHLLRSLDVMDFALSAESECFTTEEHREAVDTFLTQDSR